MINAGGIVRVSGPGQKDNTSRKEQAIRIQEYCTARGYNLVCIESEIVSGTFVFARGGFRKLCEMAQNSEINVIVADRADRFGRGDAIAQLEILARLHRTHVEYAVPSHDTSTAEGYMMKMMEQFVSGVERQNIKRRSMDGKQSRAREGRVIATWRRPYGLDFDKVKDPETGRTKSCTFKKYSEDGGREYAILMWMYGQVLEHHWTCGQIARHLNENGVQPPIKDGKPKARQWWRESVHVILTNGVYKGEWYYGKNRHTVTDTPDGIRYHTQKLKLEDAILIHVEPVISPEKWGLVQRQLKINKSVKFHRPTVNNWMLRGRIKCANCGLTWSGLSQLGSKRTLRLTRYYRCRGSSTNKILADRCSGNYVNAELLEGTVWDVICHEMNDIDGLIHKIEDRLAQTGAARQKIEAMVVELEKSIAEANRRIDRLVELFSRERLTEDQFERQKASADKELVGFQSAQKEWISKLDDWPEVQRDFIDELNQIRNDVSKRLNPATSIEVRAHIVEALELQVVYDHKTNELTISGLICPPKLTLPELAKFRENLVHDGFEGIGDNDGVHSPSDHNNEELLSSRSTPIGSMKCAAPVRAIAGRR